jgi:hypothetical protein
MSVEFKSRTASDGATIITAHENSLFSEIETLSVKVSDVNNGQIENIYWQGDALLDSSIEEAFPSVQEDFKKQRVLFIPAGESLIIADVRKRGIYQFRRSYSMTYDDDNEEYIIEVIYNVKNHSDAKPLKYKWSSALTLKNKASLLKSVGDWDDSKSAIAKMGNGVLHLGVDSEKELLMKIAATDIKGISLEMKKQKFTIANCQDFSLDFKEKMTWKIQYRFKVSN